MDPIELGHLAGLQASELGAPVYRAMGFDVVGRGAIRGPGFRAEIMAS